MTHFDLWFCSEFVSSVTNQHRRLFPTNASKIRCFQCVRFLICHLWIKIIYNILLCLIEIHSMKAHFAWWMSPERIDNLNNVCAHISEPTQFENKTKNNNRHQTAKTEHYSLNCRWSLVHAFQFSNKQSNIPHTHMHNSLFRTLCGRIIKKQSTRARAVWIHFFVIAICLFFLPNNCRAHMFMCVRVRCTHPSQSFIN